MARIVLTDAYVKLNNVDLSDHIASIEIAQSFDAVETTAFGNSARTRVGGLEDSSITLSFHQDFASASVDQTIAPLVGGTAAFEIRARGTATAVSATNPKWTGSVLVTEWSPLSGAVGELSTADVTWPVSGPVVRGTAA
jgi:hypothetical protein